MDDAEVLDSTTNAAVVQLSGRSFPGLLIQGDTFSTLVTDLREIDVELVGGSPVSAHAALRDLLVRMESLLLHYEQALDSRGIPLPYSIRPL
jgi:hypothetical protein